jgi:hypothetical protein
MRVLYLRSQGKQLVTDLKRKMKMRIDRFQLELKHRDHRQYWRGHLKGNQIK